MKCMPSSVRASFIIDYVHLVFVVERGTNYFASVNLFSLQVTVIRTGHTHWVVNVVVEPRWHFMFVVTNVILLLLLAPELQHVVMHDHTTL